MPPLPRTREQAVAAFWSKVDVKGSDECWNWKGANNGKKGYGKLKWFGRFISAHRLAFFLSGGVLPEGMSVLHTCDNPCCVNPIHLFVGTNRDNVDDCIGKGRQAKGTRVPSAKLTEASVIELRQDHEAGFSVYELATKYGISPQAAWLAAKQITWKHV
jgi:hypothetical protein